MMPTLTALCGGTLPERKIDGHDIRPLMLGTEGAKSPHEAYVLMHGPGAVRSGPWKFYPWQEGKGKQRDSADWKPSTDPVQLYDTVHDIGERTNVAAQHPDVVQRLQAAYDNHVAEIKANRRPNIKMERPENAASNARPERTNR